MVRRGHVPGPSTGQQVRLCVVTTGHALRAGLGQKPAAVTFAVIARLAAALLPRTGVRPLVLIGCPCFLAGFGWLAQAHAASGYVTSVLGPTVLIAVGVGLTFPTLMAPATADVPEGDAGIVGGLANTTTQIGGSVGLAVLATAASAGTRMEAGGSSPVAAGYDLVFLAAAGLGLAIAVVSVLLPHARAAARRGPTRPTATPRNWAPGIRRRTGESEMTTTIAAIAGSLRRGSVNRLLLQRRDRTGQSPPTRTADAPGCCIGVDNSADSYARVEVCEEPVAW